MGNARGAAVLAAATMLVAAAHGSHAHGGGLATLLSTSAVPATGGAYSPPSWAAALLTSLGDPHTSCNMNAITAWEAYEGGHWNNDAWFNPLNTTFAGPGWFSNGKITATINSSGVRAYKNWRTGLQATVITLDEPQYGDIRAALQAGDNAQAVADAVTNDNWGTAWFPANC